MMTNVHTSNNNETTDVVAIPPLEKKRDGRGKTTGLSTQKKRKENENKKLKVVIPPDRTIAVGAGAKDFVTELSVKVLHNARHDVKTWKGIPDLAKDRIVVHMLDTFQLPHNQHNRDIILQTAKNLYRYRRSRHHDHFKKFATKEVSLQNMPADVNEAEWKFLAEYFSSNDFKKMSERNKSNKAKQEVNRICGKKFFQAVSYEGVKQVVAEQIQEIEEGTDVDPIINAVFVQVVGEKLKYILVQGSGLKPASRRSRDEIQEQLQAQQKEAEEERRKRENVESKLMKVQNQLEKRQNREVMEARLVRDKKLLKDRIMALISHMQNFENGLPAVIFNIITNSTSSDETSPMDDNWLLEELHERQKQESEMQKELNNLKDNLSSGKKNLVAAAYECDKFRSLCDQKDAELQGALKEKQNLETRLSKLSSQDLNKKFKKELVEANNQVFQKIQEELRARTMLRTAEESKTRLLSEKASLEEKITRLEKKKSSEDEHAYFNTVAIQVLLEDLF